jgi:hypothetical protein
MSVWGYQLTEKFYSQPGYNGFQYFVALCLTKTMYTVKKLDKSVVAVENPPTQEKEKII